MEPQADHQRKHATHILVMITLKAYQERHAAKMVGALLEEGNVALDCSSTGAGKTYVALYVAQVFQVRPLVVGPKSSRTAWEMAAEHTEMGLDFIHYEALLAQAKAERKPGNPPARWGRWARLNERWEWNLDSFPDPDQLLIIFDEAHRLTGETSKSSRMLAATRDQEIPTLLLSATPFYSPRKMRAMAYRFGLTRNFLKGTFDGWCLCNGGYYGRFNQIQFDDDEMPAIWKSIRASMGDRIHGIDKDKVPGFPERQDLVRFIDVNTPKMDVYYQELEQLYLEAPTEMVEQLRLRQMIELAKMDAVIDQANDLISQGYSVPIFINYVDTAVRIAQKLKCLTYTGQDPQEVRESAVRGFQANEAHVLVLTHSAGSESINLHDLHGRPRASLILPGFNSTQFVQTLGRIHRSGALSKATNYLVFAADSEVEKRVGDLLTQKLISLEAVTDADLGATMFQSNV